MKQPKGKKAKLHMKPSEDAQQEDRADLKKNIKKRSSRAKEKTKLRTVEKLMDEVEKIFQDAGKRLKDSNPELVSPTPRDIAAANG